MANRFTLQNMTKQMGGPVTISSVLINMDELKPETIDAIRNAATLAAVNKASELWGAGQSLTIRDLTGTDMAYAQFEFLETANAGAGWNAMAFGAFTVPTATVIAIYGVKLGCPWSAAVGLLPISGIRIDVGGSRHAQWHVQTLDKISDAASVDGIAMLGGVTRSPVIIAEDITVTIFENTTAAGVGLAYYAVWLGVAVEKEGVTLKP